jgi:hypothetical protein
LIPKNQAKNFSNGFLHSEYLWQGEPLCLHSIDCCFVSGSWSHNHVSSRLQITTGNHLDRSKKN